MKRLLFLALSAVLLHSCKEERPAQLKTGDWWATMAVTDSIDLPFNFTLAQDEAGSLSMVIQNADERVVVDEIELQGDSIRIQMPVFEGYIAGTYTPERITGSFIKESLDRIVPFNASFGTRERFASTAPAAVNVSGIWETQFDFDTDDPYSAKGIFYQTGNKVTGTFRTTTGDYRYLEGVVDGEELQLSLSMAHMSFCSRLPFRIVHCKERFIPETIRSSILRPNGMTVSNCPMPVH